MSVSEAATYECERVVGAQGELIDTTRSEVVATTEHGDAVTGRAVAGTVGGMYVPGVVQFLLREGGCALLELGPADEIRVKGKLVANDIEVVDALREFIGIKRESQTPLEREVVRYRMALGRIAATPVNGWPDLADLVSIARKALELDGVEVEG